MKKRRNKLAVLMALALAVTSVEGPVLTVLADVPAEDTVEVAAPESDVTEEETEMTGREALDAAEEVVSETEEETEPEKSLGSEDDVVEEEETEGVGEYRVFQNPECVYYDFVSFSDIVYGGAGVNFEFWNENSAVSGQSKAAETEDYFWLYDYENPGNKIYCRIKNAAGEVLNIYDILSAGSYTIEIARGSSFKNIEQTLAITVRAFADETVTPMPGNSVEIMPSQEGGQAWYSFTVPETDQYIIRTRRGVDWNFFGKFSYCYPLEGAYAEERSIVLTEGETYYFGFARDEKQAYTASIKQMDVTQSVTLKNADASSVKVKVGVDNDLNSIAEACKNLIDIQYENGESGSVQSYWYHESSEPLPGFWDEEGNPDVPAERNGSWLRGALNNAYSDTVALQFYREGEETPFAYEAYNDVLPAGSYTARFDVFTGRSEWITGPTLQVTVASRTEGATEIALNKEQEIAEENGEVRFTFTPEHSGKHRFRIDVAYEEIQVYDEADQNVTSGGYDGEYQMEAGKTYCVIYTLAKTGVPSCTVTVEEIKIPELASAKTYKTHKTLVAGISDVADALVTEFTYQDGTSSKRTVNTGMFDYSGNYKAIYYIKQGDQKILLDWESSPGLAAGTYDVYTEIEVTREDGTSYIVDQSIDPVSVEIVLLQEKDITEVTENTPCVQKQGDYTQFYRFTAPRDDTYQLKKQPIPNDTQTGEVEYGSYELSFADMADGRLVKREGDGDARSTTLKKGESVLIVSEYMYMPGIFTVEKKGSSEEGHENPYEEKKVKNVEVIYNPTLDAMQNENASWTDKYDLYATYEDGFQHVCGYEWGEVIRDWFENRFRIGTITELFDEETETDVVYQMEVFVNDDTTPYICKVRHSRETNIASISTDQEQSWQYADRKPENTWYQFVPEVSGEYVFELKSDAKTTEKELKILTGEESKSSLEKTWESYDKASGCVRNAYRMRAGQTYYINVEMGRPEEITEVTAETVTIKMTKGNPVRKISVIPESIPTQYAMGGTAPEFMPYGTKLDVLYEDGTRKTVTFGDDEAFGGTIDLYTERNINSHMIEMCASFGGRTTTFLVEVSTEEPPELPVNDTMTPADAQLIIKPDVTGLYRFRQNQAYKYTVRESLGNVLEYTAGFDGRYYKLIAGEAYYLEHFYSNGMYNDLGCQISAVRVDENGDPIEKKHVHEMVKTEAKAATCTEDGRKEFYECSDCHKIFTDAQGENEVSSEELVVKAPGHRYVEKVTAPTYEAKGFTTHTCSVCGDSYKDSYVAELVLAVPTVKTENATAGAQVSWTKVTGAKGYYVYRKTGNGKYQKLVATDKNTLKYVDKTAKSGTTYYYTVRAYSGKALSPYKAGKAFIRLANPAVKLSKAGTGVKVSWKTIKGAKGYYVYRKIGSGSYKKIKTIKGASTLAYTDKTAKKGTKYTYYVKAYNGSFASSYTAKSIKR